MNIFELGFFTDLFTNKLMQHLDCLFNAIRSRMSLKARLAARASNCLHNQLYDIHNPSIRRIRRL